MQSAFRRNLVRLHTWVGLSAGFAMLFLAVTGGLLVMRPHFEDMLNRNLVSASTCAAPLPLDRVGEIARAAGPREKLDSYEIAREPGRSVAVKFGNKDYVYVDACTGRVQGVQNQYGGFYGVVDWLHRFRFMENGRDVAGWLNLTVLVFLVVGGLVLWWPASRGGFKAALQFNGRLPGIARTLSLHKVIGIYACALLLALTVTGLPLSFDWAKGVIAAATHSPTENPRHKFPHLKLRGPRLPVEVLWTRAEAAVPDMTWGAIKTAKDNGVVEVELLQRGAPHANAKSYLYLNSVTGQVLEFAPYATAMPLGRKVYLYVLALHSGLIGGISYQLALMVACFSVPVQVYSGLSPYLRKKFRRAARPGLALRVVARREEAEGVCSFEFEEARGRPLPPFSAGS
ncbi:MAG TPA: PepSY domain-containing protein, partial [Phenylobacterium sp.]|nr:PepSY domain-containing protein [Phenylobacterium sp.]